MEYQQKSDWVMAFDENGEPFIAHAWGKRGSNKSHKYIAKIGKGIKTRYFYTKSELEAYYNQTKEKASDKTKNFLRKNVSGYREREAAISTKQKADRARREQVASAKRLSDAVDDELKARDTYKNYPTVKTEKDYQKAKARTRIASDDYYGTKNSEGKLTRANKAEEKAFETMEKYRNTSLYKVEEFSKDPIGNTTKFIEDAALDAVWTLEDKVNSIKEKRQQKKNAKKELRMQSDPLVSKARKNYQDATIEYNKANNKFMQYMMSKNAVKNSDEWNRLERDYLWTIDQLDYASKELEKAERKYK